MHVRAVRIQYYITLERELCYIIAILYLNVYISGFWLAFHLIRRKRHALLQEEK